MSVRLFVRIEQIGYHRKDFRDISYMIFFFENILRKFNID